MARIVSLNANIPHMEKAANLYATVSWTNATSPGDVYCTRQLIESMKKQVCFMFITYHVIAMNCVLVLTYSTIHYRVNSIPFLENLNNCIDIWFTDSRKTTLTSLIPNVTIPNRLVTRIVSTEITKLSDATLNTIIKEDIFFKNNFVITLLGIFVLFFCIFVLTYVYFKCCRKSTIND